MSKDRKMSTISGKGGDQPAYDYWGESKDTVNQFVDGLAAPLYSKKPNMWIALAIVFFTILSFQLFFIGWRDWDTTCENPIAIWCFVTGGLLCITALVMFLVKFKYWWNKKTNKAPFFFKIWLFMIIPALFVMTVLGCVWILTWPECGEYLFYHALVTEIVLLLIVLCVIIGAFIILIKLWTSGKLPELLVNLLRLVIDTLNDKFFRFCLAILVLIYGIIFTILIAVFWEDTCSYDNFNTSLREYVMTIGILAIVFASVLITIELIAHWMEVGEPKFLHKVPVLGKKLKNRRMKKQVTAGERDDAQAEVNEVEEQLIEDEAQGNWNDDYEPTEKQKKIIKAMRLTADVLFLFFVVLGTCITIWGTVAIEKARDTCDAQDQFETGDAAAIIWWIILVLFILINIIRFCIKPFRGTSHMVAAWLALNVVSCVCMVIGAFALFTLFVGGYTWDMNCDQPLALFITAFATILLTLCCLGVFTDRYGISRGGDNAYHIMTIMCFILIAILFGIGCFGTLYFIRSETCRDDAFELWVWACVVMSLFLLVVVTVVIYLAWKWFFWVNKQGAGKMPAETKVELPEVKVDGNVRFSHAFVGALAFYCAAMVFVSGNEWQSTCDQPLQEWLLVFAVDGFLLFFFMLLWHFHKTFLPHELGVSPGAIVIVGLIGFTLVALLAWGIIGTVWFYLADTCSADATTLYTWVFLSLIGFILGILFGVVKFFMSVLSIREKTQDDQATLLGDKEVVDATDTEPLNDALRRNRAMIMYRWQMMVSFIVVTIWCLWGIIVSGVRFRDSCDYPVQVFTFLYGIVIFCLCVYTFVIKLYGMRHPEELYDRGWKARVPQYILLVFAIAVWCVEFTFLFISKDCVDALPEVWNTQFLQIVSMCVFVLLCAGAYVVHYIGKWTGRAVKDDLEQKAINEGDEESSLSEARIRHRQKLRELLNMTIGGHSLVPVSCTNLSVSTIVLSMCVFLCSVAIYEWKKDCESNLQAFIMVTGGLVAIVVLIEFIRACVNKDLQVKESVVMVVVRLLFIAFLLTWGVVGSVWFGEAYGGSCNATAPRTFKASFTVLVMFGAGLVYGIFKTIQAWAKC